MTDVQPVITPAPATPAGVDASKVTIIASALVTVLPLVPGVGPVLAGIFGASPQLLTSIVGALFGSLHFAHTKGWIK